MTLFCPSNKPRWTIRYPKLASGYKFTLKLTKVFQLSPDWTNPPTDVVHVSALHLSEGKIGPLWLIQGFSGPGC